MRKMLFVILLLFGLGGAYVSRQDHKNQQSVVQSIPSRADKKRTPLKLGRYLPANKTIPSGGTFPPECHDSLRDLTGMTADEYLEILKSKNAFHSFFTSDCLSQFADSAIYQALTGNGQCRLLDDEYEFSNETMGFCMSFLFALKAFAIAEYARDVPIEKMTSEELAANFVKMFFSLDKLDKKTFQDNLGLLDVFYQQHGHDPNVIEAYLGYLIIGQQMIGEEMVADKIESIGSTHQGESFKLDRLLVLKSMIKGDLKNTKSALDKMGQIYPREPDLQYHYAAYFWKKGDRAQAIRYLDRAIAMGEECSYCIPALYRETKQRLVRAKPGDQNLFSVSVGLNFENL
jgi:tetratricopeptide (TPR) repeat protein